MELLYQKNEMLDLMVRPAFAVREHRILARNDAAKRYLLDTDAPVEDWISIGQEDYAAFTGGSLYLTMNIAGKDLGACVTRIDGSDIFVLEEDTERVELQAMALAAQELRGPLASVMTVADQLFPQLEATGGADIADQLHRINRGLYQLLRVVGNMSDASRYLQDTTGHCQTCNLTAFLQEVVSGVQALVGASDISLEFQNLEETLYCLVDREKLERGIYNLLSNALKFTPPGGTVQFRAVRRGKRLYLTVQDSGSGIAEGVRCQVFSRYRRSPGLEDGRFGIGLGMVLIRTAAAIHGGTVLLEQPEGQGTRVTMTMALRQHTGAALRSPVWMVDYAGERDHGLVELADCLSAAAYESDPG